MISKISCIVLSMLVMLLTACAPCESSDSQPSGEGTSIVEESGNPTESKAPYYDTNGGCVEHAEQFGTTAEAVQAIKAAKKAGSEKPAYPEDFALYDKDCIYLMSEIASLPDYRQESVMLYMHGTAVYFYNDGYTEARFLWTQGGENDANIKDATDRYGLEPYADTKYYFGKDTNRIVILWWEDGDEFSLEYPADAGVPPKEIIECLVVEKYDLG